MAGQSIGHHGAQIESPAFTHGYKAITGKTVHSMRLPDLLTALGTSAFFGIGLYPMHPYSCWLRLCF